MNGKSAASSNGIVAASSDNIAAAAGLCHDSAPGAIDAVCEKYSGCIESCRLVSSFICRDGASIVVIDVLLKSAQYGGFSGVTQRFFISRLLSITQSDAVIAAFHSRNDLVWRLSFATYADGSISKEGKQGLIPVKRISFIAGTGMSVKFAQRQLLQLFNRNGGNSSLQEIGKAFSRKTAARKFINECLKQHQAGSDLAEPLDFYGFSAIESESYDEVAAVDTNMLSELYENMIDGKARKRSGTFYTPKEIVQHMCIESISTYLANKTGAPYEDIREFLQNGDWLAGPESIFQRMEEIDLALEEIKVLDPAAGSGAFPVCMLNEIVRARMKLTEFLIRKIRLDDEQARDDFRKYRNEYDFKYQAIKNSIYSVDINATAAGLTKLRLWLSLAVSYKDAAGLLPTISELKCNVVCGDSLLHETDWSTGKHFDIVIGNPPYISAVEGSKNDKGLREALKRKYPLLNGAFDVCMAFLLDAVEKTNKNGAYCWIVPNKLLVSDYAEPVLNFLKLHGLQKIVSISGIDAFSGAGVYPIIILGNKKSTGFGEYTAVSLHDLIYGRLRPKTDLRSYKTFADFGITFSSGATGFQAKLLSDCISDHAAAGAIPFIVSGSVDKFSVDYRNVRYMGKIYDKAYITRGKGITDRKWSFWCGEKIVIAGLTRELEAFCCSGPLALGVGVYAIHGFAGFKPLFLLGLLNSKFLSWYLNIKFGEKHLAGGYLAVNKSTLEQLPLVNADKDLQSRIADIAGNIQKMTAQLQDSGAGKKQIEKAVRARMDELDGLVYKLYNLNSSEIAEVERFFT